MSLLLRRDPKRPAVTRLRPGTKTDFYGDPVESWAPEDVARLPLPRAEIEHRSVEETEGDGRRVIRRETVLFSPDRLDVVEDDRVEVGSQVWRVNGPPVVRRGLALGTFSTATLTRISG